MRKRELKRLKQRRAVVARLIYILERASQQNSATKLMPLPAPARNHDSAAWGLVGEQSTAEVEGGDTASRQMPQRRRLR